MSHSDDPFPLINFAFLVNERTLVGVHRPPYTGVGAPHQYPLKSRLANFSLPLYADVRGCVF